MLPPRERRKADPLPLAVADLTPRLANLVTSLKSFDDTFQWARQLVHELLNEDSGDEGFQTAWDAIANMPATTFSELLRSLDPVMVAGRFLDPTAGMYISRHRAERTTLGHLVGKYGVRHVYHNLLHMVSNLAKYRLHAGHSLGPNDYKVMMRCAGATSDPVAVKKMWLTMEDAGLREARDGSAYAEFIKARFLTDPLYSQFDLSRLRVRPINLGATKANVHFSRRTRRRLRVSRWREITKQVQQFGQIANKPRMESLTRIVMGWQPITRVWYKVKYGLYEWDEDLLCAGMVAFARAGAMRFFERHILFRFYKIQVRKDKETGGRWVTAPGGPVHAPGSPLYPTEKLLEAVVEAYCCNAELERAAKVADVLSTRYGVPISEKVWFRMLEWAYVQASLPASREWKAAGMPHKVVTAEAVQLIWDTMTAPPYHVKPGFRQYEILVNLLLARNRLKQAMECMLELEPFYSGLQASLEDPFFRQASADALGVASPARSWFGDEDPGVAWAVAVARKDLVFQVFQNWCRSLLARVRSNRIDDVMTTRLVPQLLDAFRDVLPSRLRYRIATGLVEMAGVEPVQRMHYNLRLRPMPPANTGDVMSLLERKGNISSRRRRRIERASLMPVPELLTRPLDPAMIASTMPSRAELQRQFT